MFNSIIEDIKYQFRAGNTLTHLIIVNIAVFVFLKLIFVFASFGSVGGIYDQIIKVLALPSGIPDFGIYFWTWVTHMFLHEGAWHLIWNMLLLYWFGRIVGDFLGDRRVLPIYLLGGFVGAIFYIISDQFLGSGGNAIAMGASAATMAMIFSAAMTSPDYEFNLILIGPIKIKYIAIVILFFDIVGTTSQINSGGHFAHLGGALFGIFFINRLQNGSDITEWLQKLISKFSKDNNEDQIEIRSKVPMEVVYNKNKNINIHSEAYPQTNFQERLDEILDKINHVGFEKLTKEEKEFLDNASKK